MVNNDNKVQDDIVSQKKVIEFYTVASEFCRFIESTTHNDKLVFKETILRLLLLLYLKGSLLPKLLPKDENANERFVNEEQWQEIYLLLKSILKEDDDFDKILLEEEIDSSFENKINKGSISEHLADIWQDIKDFVLLFNKNNIAAKENAIWSCYILFRENWGRKTAELINVLHNKVFEANYDQDLE
ncbi:MAG TPA: DUF5063 domain-containing protein [Bacteroidales bacterium]|nr:DUF5063 domain-containing protein [Bacteroidales bacterium]